MTVDCKRLLSHFTVFYFLSCLDISEWKAYPTKPSVCKMVMIDVIIANTTLNAEIYICTQFLVVLRSQALRKNFDLCLGDAVANSA